MMSDLKISRYWIIFYCIGIIQATFQILILKYPVSSVLASDGAKVEGCSRAISKRAPFDLCPKALEEPTVKRMKS